MKNALQILTLTKVIAVCAASIVVAQSSIEREIETKAETPGVTRPLRSSALKVASGLLQILTLWFLMVQNWVTRLRKIPPFSLVRSVRSSDTLPKL